MQHLEHQITDNRNSITFLGNMLGVLVVRSSQISIAL